MVQGFKALGPLGFWAWCLAKSTVLASVSGASVNKSAVPASVSCIRELKSTDPAIDFHRVFEGRANIVSLSSFLLAFFLCVICLFLFLSFRLGVVLQRPCCNSVFLAFRLFVSLQLCFVLAVFLCCFLLARLVVIH